MVPPRGRNRKPRNTRMDAAMDALQQLGFSKTVVRKRVNHLLSVYGGEDSWVFIEESSYKVLIDSFLDEQEEAMSIQCIEDKKDDDTSIKEGEIVPCLENGSASMTPHLEVVVPLRRSYELTRSDDESDDDELLHFPPATSQSHILFTEPQMGNTCVFHVVGNKNIEENISSQAGKGKSLIQLNNNCSGSGIGMTNNIKQEVRPLHMNNYNNNNKRREKRQVVVLTSDPYPSHK